MSRLSDQDLIKVLDLLLEYKETHSADPGEADTRQGRQGRQLVFNDPELDGFTLDQERTQRQASSSSSQLEEELLGFERDEICERTGFETRKSEECQVQGVPIKRPHDSTSSNNKAFSWDTL